MITSLLNGVIFLLNGDKLRLNIWLEKMGNENSQAGIFAHESGEIIRKLSLKTFEAEYKIMIIWLPEKMNPASANKLLKMIEEPPSKTLFLLVSDFPEQIINTIRSRSQFIKIPRIDDESVVQHLIWMHKLEKRQGYAYCQKFQMVTSIKHMIYCRQVKLKSIILKCTLKLCA